MDALAQYPDIYNRSEIQKIFYYEPREITFKIKEQQQPHKTVNQKNQLLIKGKS